MVKSKLNFTHCKKKTELVIFKPEQKKFEGDLKIKLCGKRLYPTESVKYLGVKIDANLGNMLTIFPLKRIEPMISFLKRENMLVLKL